MNKDTQFVKDMLRCRGIDFAHIGMMVEVYGDLGTIVGMNDSANLDVVFTNQLKHGKHKANCHPTCEVKYFDAQGNVIADFTTPRSLAGVGRQRAPSTFYKAILTGRSVLSDARSVLPRLFRGGFSINQPVDVSRKVECRPAALSYRTVSADAQCGNGRPVGQTVLYLTVVNSNWQPALS